MNLLIKVTPIINGEASKPIMINPLRIEAIIEFGSNWQIIFAGQWKVVIRENILHFFKTVGVGSDCHID